MKILVTGGTGFTGSHLVRRLLSRGHEVRTLDISPGLISAELATSGAKLLSGSVGNADVVDAAVAGSEVVFHLASPFRDVLAPEEAYRVTEVAGIRNVLQSAERHGVRRVVHTSTQGVHGSLSETPGDEESPITPLDYYCASKVDAEAVCNEFIARGMDVVIVRPTSIYGPGDLHGWLKLFRIVRNGRFLMLGNGGTMNHPVYIDNLVDLFELAMHADRAKGRTYLAGDDEPVTLNELVETIGAVMGKEVRIIRIPAVRVAWLAAAAVELVCKPLGISPPVFRRRLSWFTTNRAFRIDRAKRELGYLPRVPLVEGLARTAAWYREHGHL